MLKELDDLIETARHKGYTLDEETLRVLRNTALEREIVDSAVSTKGRHYSAAEVEEMTTEGIDADEFLANPHAFLSKAEADDGMES
jgi:hypothetical protein